MSVLLVYLFFFFSSRRRHTRYWRDWSSDVCSSDLDSLREAIDQNGLPDVLDPLTPTQVPDVAAPDQALLSSPVVDSVSGSVVQISGVAPSCSRQIDGSRFVYADERGMANAHGLAGVTHPVVLAEGLE